MRKKNHVAHCRRLDVVDAVDHLKKTLFAEARDPQFAAFKYFYNKARQYKANFFFSGTLRNAYNQFRFFKSVYCSSVSTEDRLSNLSN